MIEVPHSVIQGAAQPSAARDESAVSLLEQYKLYVGTAEKLSDRRANMHTLLLAVNSLLVTVYSTVASKDARPGIPIASWRWLAPIPAAGVLITFSWLMLILSYRKLSSAKFSVIDQMEQRLPFQTFKLEWELVRTNSRGGYLTFSTIESFIPIAFAAIYVILAIE
jgi:hypothetical protein